MIDENVSINGSSITKLHHQQGWSQPKKTYPFELSSIELQKSILLTVEKSEGGTKCKILLPISNYNWSLIDN